MLTKLEKAKLGLHFFEEAILKVLHETQNEGRLHAGAIRECLGISNVPQDYADNNTLVKGAYIILGITDL